MVLAAADLRGLAELVPAQSRLVLDPSGKAAHEAPEEAALETASVPTSSIREGDVLRILPGERIPVDGTVLSGRSSADEAMLTGESALVPKAVDSQVIQNSFASCWTLACMLDRAQQIPPPAGDSRDRQLRGPDCGPRNQHW